ncbi:MAG: hypothetical protein GXO08_05945 [Aquificae bacterium]|nr:hypothetical protein [Aquificota bacterium]
MFKKLLAVAALAGASFGATLTELLDTVQRLITDYEVQGKAVTEPYTYNKLVNYYSFGKLYTSYMLDEQATEMLSMAACSALPADCKAHKYFVKNLNYESYRRALESLPVLLAEVETAYNAYAEWWIGKRTSDDEVYRQYRNLESVLKERFLNAWRAFLSAAEKPLYFQISEKVDWNDLFLLAMLKLAYHQGWINKVVYHGDWVNYRELTVKKWLPYGTEFKPETSCRTHDFVVVY